MKNNDANRNIIRAISIGIAAMLAIMPSTTAFASDGEREGGRSRRHRSEEGSSRHHRHSDRSERISEARDEVSRAADEAENYSSEHHEESSNYQAPAPDFSAPAPDFSAPAPDFSAPAPEAAVPAADVSAPTPDFSAPAPEASAPDADVSAPVFPAPAPEAAAPAPEASAPAADVSAPAPEIVGSSGNQGNAEYVIPQIDPSDTTNDTNSAGTGVGEALSDAEGKADKAATYNEIKSDLSDAKNALDNISSHSTNADDAIGDNDKNVETSGYMIDNNTGNVIPGGFSFDPDTGKLVDSSEKPDDTLLSDLGNVGDSNDLTGYVKDYVKNHVAEASESGTSFDDAWNSLKKDENIHIQGHDETEAARTAVDSTNKKTDGYASESDGKNSDVQKAAYLLDENGNYLGIYDTQEESVEARETARAELSVIDDMLTESKTAVQDASDKLDEAERVLNNTQIALDNAKVLADDADKKVDAARKKYEILLNDLGPKGTAWDYNEKTGEYIILIKDKDFNNISAGTNMGTALTKTAAAYDEAKKNAEKAAGEVEGAKKDVLDAQEDFKNAKDNLAEALDTHNAIKLYTADTIKHFVDFANEDISNYDTGLKNNLNEATYNNTGANTNLYKVDENGNQVLDKDNKPIFNNSILKDYDQNIEDVLENEIKAQRALIEGNADVKYDNNGKVNKASYNSDSGSSYVDDVNKLAKSIIKYQLLSDGKYSDNCSIEVINGDELSDPNHIASYYFGKDKTTQELKWSNYQYIKVTDKDGNITYYSYEVLLDSNGNNAKYLSNIGSCIDKNTHLLVSKLDYEADTESEGKFIITGSSMYCSEYQIKNEFDDYHKKLSEQRTNVLDALDKKENADYIVNSISTLNKLVFEYDEDGNIVSDKDGNMKTLGNLTADQWGKKAAAAKAISDGYDIDELTEKVNKLQDTVGLLTNLKNDIITLKANIAKQDYSYIGLNGKVTNKGKDNTSAMRANRLLASYLLKYQLLQELGDSIDHFGDFDPNNWKGGDIDKHYGCLKVYIKGEEKPSEYYFDYNALFANGEIVDFTQKLTAKNGDGIDHNYLNNLSADNPIMHIDVLLKNVEAYGSDNLPSTFAGKGISKITDTQFEGLKTNAEKDLEEALRNLDNAKNAKIYADYIAEKANAKALELKVKNALEKVQEAAKELMEAKKIQNVNQELIAQLSSELENAKKERDTAEKSLEKAKANLELIQDAYDDISGAVNDYVNAFKVKEKTDDTNNDENPDDPGNKPDDKNDTPEDPDEPGARPGGTGGGTGGGNGGGGTGGGAGGGGGDATGPATPAAPSVASAVTPAPTFFADAPAGGVLGDISAPTITGVFTGGVPGAGAIDTGTPAAGGIEAGALMEEGMPEGGVLGERLAPIAPFVEDVENGTFSRGKLFTEEGLKLSFAWWLIIFLLGAKGVMMILDKNSRKKNPDA